MSNHTLQVHVQFAPDAEQVPRLQVTVHSPIGEVAYALRTAEGSTKIPSPVTSAARPS